MTSECVLHTQTKRFYCCVVTKKVYVLFIITEKPRTKEEMSVYVCLFSVE